MLRRPTPAPSRRRLKRGPARSHWKRRARLVTVIARSLPEAPTPAERQSPVAEAGRHIGSVLQGSMVMLPSMPGCMRQS